MDLRLRHCALLVAALFAADVAFAQTAAWKEMHKVKRKETIFGIAKDNGLTVEELMEANPEMKQPGYKLKKGDFIFIPYPKAAPAPQAQAQAASAPQPPAAQPADDMRRRAIRVGVMLPLHDINGDGRRMVEYYRGVLMACDSLKQEGVPADIRAWNVPEKADIGKTLRDKDAARCDLIIGPLYSTQVKALSDFAAAHGIKVLIPFSIIAPELSSNPNLFQVYQNEADYNDAVIARFLERFAGHHVVFVDCNDASSKKGSFTLGLRRRMETMGRNYSITNLQSAEDKFAKAFSTDLPNVVVLNTGRSPELNIAFAKLNNFSTNNPNAKVTLFGYTEWMMYTKYNLDNYYKYNVHIPAAFYTNPLSSKTARIELKYRWNFHEDMLQALPRFAITGFDQAYYFIKGLHLYGDRFVGARGTVGYVPIQTPLHFERVGSGGYQNKSILFVRYSPEHRIETINF